MPELPEVETVLRSVRSHILGRTILEVRFFSALVSSGRSDELSARLTGQRIVEIRRQGKHLLICMQGGGILDIHLRMTGKLRVDGEPNAYTRALLTLDSGALRFDDVRQFGKFVWRETNPPIGPDALAVTSSEFVALIKYRRARIKSVLLNQKIISGLGNIYVDEILHSSGVHPLALASRLSVGRLQRMHQHMLATLDSAIQSGGSSISDYVDARGQQGSFQLRHAVYGREGHPCPTCATPIRRIVVGQRGTHFCPTCQKR